MKDCIDSYWPRKLYRWSKKLYWNMFKQNILSIQTVFSRIKSNFVRSLFIQQNCIWLNKNVFTCGSVENLFCSTIPFLCVLSIQWRKIIIVKTKHVFLMLKIQLRSKELKINKSSQQIVRESGIYFISKIKKYLLISA